MGQTYTGFNTDAGDGILTLSAQMWSSYCCQGEMERGGRNHMEPDWFCPRTLIYVPVDLSGVIIQLGGGRAFSLIPLWHHRGHPPPPPPPHPLIPFPPGVNTSAHTLSWLSPLPWGVMVCVAWSRAMAGEYSSLKMWIIPLHFITLMQTIHLFRKCGHGNLFPLHIKV